MWNNPDQENIVVQSNRVCEGRIYQLPSTVAVVIDLGHISVTRAKTDLAWLAETGSMLDPVCCCSAGHRGLANIAGARHCVAILRWCTKLIIK
jgi:hypothetical protein